MREFIEFMYCCASVAPVPTPTQWFDAMNEMCTILGGHELPGYDEEPFVVVSMYHEIEETLDVAGITNRFLRGDVSTSVWGPLAWGLLHRLASCAQFQQVVALLRCWEIVLPCAECRHNLTAHMQVTSFDFSSAEQAYEYTTMLHNAVNMELGKKLYIE
jgi:hypothetical protein